MRNLSIIAVGLILLALQSALSALIGAYPYAPHLLLPVAIFLGVSHETPVVRGTSLAFVLGYLLDSFCGSPMGLQTFVMVSAFLVTRSAGLRLFLRGPAFQIGLTFLMSLLTGMTILALRAIFERPAPFPVSDTGQVTQTLLISALTTALASPVVFSIVRPIDRWATSRQVV